MPKHAADADASAACIGLNSLDFTDCYLLPNLDLADKIKLLILV